MQLKIKKFHPDARLPVYASANAAGADLFACMNEEFIVLSVGERKLVSTGLGIEIPPGFEIQIRPRSGLALKEGVTVLNAPGTIDADYRGVIGVLLYNAGNRPFSILQGDRIAQMVLAPIVQIKPVLTEELASTERGAGGFGSTGTR